MTLSSSHSRRRAGSPLSFH